MKYMGSKKRLQKYLAPQINKIIKEKGIKKYVEPFVGGANMIEAIECDTKIGIDNNKYLIALLREVADNGLDRLPRKITREHYNEVRDAYNNNNTDNKFEDYYIGYIGFMASYNGRFFDGGYSGHAIMEKGKTKPRDFIRQTINNLEKQVDKIRDVIFIHGDYRDFSYHNCLIYCDIPYKDTKKYLTSQGFDYESFYEWVKETSKKNFVIVSEYWMPEEFTEVWSKESNTNLMDTQGGKRKTKIEKLFIYDTRSKKKINNQVG